MLDRNRAREAFRVFLEAAEAGHVVSQLMVGYLFDVGEGTRRSRDLALKWYRRAARRGNSSAANNIGTIYRDENKPRLALRWFEQAVRLGECDSLFEIAKLYAGPLNSRRRALAALRSLRRQEQVTEIVQEGAAQLEATLRESMRTRRRSRTEP